MNTGRHFMALTGPTQSLPTLTLATLPPTPPTWRVGQRLEAVVVALLSQGRVALRIGEALLEARTTLATSPGQRLTLQVAQTDKQAVLRIVTEPPPQAAPAPKPTPMPNPMLAALRVALPQQLPLQTVFTRFAQLLTAAPGPPPPVTAALKQLLQQLPNAQTLSQTESLRQALADTGLPLEHKLRPQTPPAAVNRDLKANLLRLLAEAARSQGDGGTDLIRHAEAALARIQLHQFAALTHEHPLSWAGELPMRNGDDVTVLQFRIEKDGEQAGPGQAPAWSTWLSLDLHPLGPLHTKLTLRGNALSAALWAESPATAQLVEEHIPHLQQTLEHAGLEVHTLRCRQGRPPFPEPARLPAGLVDQNA